MQRRQTFSLALAAAGGWLLLHACGQPPRPAGLVCTAEGDGIGGRHGHALRLPLAELAADAGRARTIAGSADHDHLVRLTARQLAALRAGRRVTLETSVEFAHAHTLVLACE